jgi:hypothetical protein
MELDTRYVFTSNCAGGALHYILLAAHNTEAHSTHTTTTSICGIPRSARLRDCKLHCFCSRGLHPATKVDNPTNHGRAGMLFHQLLSVEFEELFLSSKACVPCALCHHGCGPGSVCNLTNVRTRVTCRIPTVRLVIIQAPFDAISRRRLDWMRHGALLLAHPLSFPEDYSFRCLYPRPTSCGHEAWRQEMKETEMQHAVILVGASLLPAVHLMAVNPRQSSHGQ